ncbi:MAG: hypothetical protein RLZZ422_1365 [Pseudomonadota bacterium]|jgi:anthranilate synthase component 1
MNRNEFDRYIAAGFNRIPVSRKILADLDTPLSTYLKLADSPYTYLFESVQGGEKWGRYSIIGLAAKTVIQVYDHRIEVHKAHQDTEYFEAKDPLAWIEAYQAQFKVPDLPDLPRFNGGLVGYFGYDTIRYIEPKLAKTSKPDPIGTPDILLMVSDEVIVFDSLRGEMHLIVLSDAQGFDKATARLDQLERQLQEARRLYQMLPLSREVEESDFVSGFTEEGFKDAVEKAREYIKAGDIMQVVLSQRMTLPFNAPPLDLYRALRRLNPSPYMYFLNLGNFHIVGSSPEILVRLEDDTVTVRPIAGTRRRGVTEEQDKALEQELLNDPKELAEHLMLIDLGRNDAGRVSQIGSVALTDKMVIERYSHVMHIVSNVTGKLLPNQTAMDVLRATFPAGTVSGAPKIRAMEIIDELEPVKRGIYSGAVGYIAWNGNMDTAIAIRTAVIKDEQLYIQAGAGVVYDSIPQSEWDETMNKGRAVFKAASVALAGISGKHR